MRSPLLLLLFLIPIIGQCQESSPEAKRLKELAERMNGLHDLLREDRHDSKVQLEGQIIENEISFLIEKMEQQQKEQQQQDQQKQQQSGKKKQERQAQQGSSGSPLADSAPGAPATEGKRSQPPAQVQGKQSSWSSLPKAQRDELLQAYGAEMPLKWRKRLEAYFFSLAAEEEKYNGRK
jgi:hypothetical protein